MVLNSTATNSTITHPFVQKEEEGNDKFRNLYFVATKRTTDNTLIIKLASVDSDDIVVKTQNQGSTTSSSDLAYILTAGTGINPSTIHNTMANPDAASISTEPISVINGTFSITVPSRSVIVVTLAL
ncbi:unnamed protein product [Rotaria magnacalcarata]|uniref:Alpha-L-arabinofuranosidase C-terminal domain-containing protein n=1 Tax=Rotaria magnacalcarata TaxID=392030 RepID=A0A814WU06_9BILA|nr:unnamed protein product [Rotaria magnacalcarata]CAF1534105.1 unnamed protein product [Rotaria magnacalcarata]CAF2058333.1 unnamed protein product [Rotaria magnacalcarata]CAF2062162.1 unnamed protein product [Rotaria magnacalcarata]CAF2091981.1 unnamed protein product [Rotaria magnacalcarata]